MARLIVQGDLLLSCQGHEVTVWEVSGDVAMERARRTVVDPWPGRKGPPSMSLAIDPHGAIACLRTLSFERSHLQRYDPDLELLSSVQLGASLGSDALSMSPAGDRFAAHLYGEGTAILDLLSGKVLAAYDGHMSYGVEYSPDGRWLATCDGGQAGGELYLIDVEAPVEEARRALPRPTCRAPLFDVDLHVAYSSDSRRVVFTSAAWGSRGVMVYDIETCEELWSVRYESATPDEELWEALTPQVLPGDQTLLVGVEGSVSAWSLETGAPLPHLPLPGAVSFPYALDPTRRALWCLCDGVPQVHAWPSSW